ncbi:hypothetical protein EYZ11_013319 [Aspergillus tanneri]|uniref:Uncharacterized protein n=1 Tax=Aspergillus tanneri TaxID=1220188 RepID=A0A4S3IXY7_9EURO|nr:hypothetical protein EYZ11_013319 [Aspergillus tanneri]
MALKSLAQLACAGIPEPDRAIIRAGCQQLTIRMALKSLAQLACAGIPELNSAVTRARCQQLTIR